MPRSISIRNKVIKLYRLLKSKKQREKLGMVVLEGYHLVNEAVRSGTSIYAVLYTGEFIKNKLHRELLLKIGEARTIQVDKVTFNAIAQTENPQGIGALAFYPRHTADFFYHPDPFMLIIDRVQDPGNLGTIIRTAAAGAVDGILLLPGTVDPFNPKALRASMGGIFYVPVVNVADFPDWHHVLAKRGVQLIAAHPRGEIPFNKVNFTIPSAVIIGNESRGVERFLLEKVDIEAYIPVRGKIDSINAAVAAAVFIFENIRQRCFSE